MQIKGKRFLVTGGSGFVGSHVVDELVEQGAADVVVLDKAIRRENLVGALDVGNVRVIEGDVTDTAGLRRALDGIDGLFHLAVLPLGPCEADPRSCLEVNVVGTFNVLEAAHEAGVQKVVYSSASSVYGDTEDTMDESHPLDARTMYGTSKLVGEYLLRVFHDKHGLDYVVLRYMNVYGPRQEAGLIANVFRRIQAGERPTIQGDGSQSFDFVHVADVARANVAAMIADVTDQAFNIGSGDEATVKEIVELLLEATGSELEPVYDREAEVLMTRRVGSNAKAVRELGWQPERDLRSGVADVVRAARASAEVTARAAS